MVQVTPPSVKKPFSVTKVTMLRAQFLAQSRRSGRRQASALHPLRGAYFAISWGEVVNIFPTRLFTYHQFSAVEHPAFGGLLQLHNV